MKEEDIDKLFKNAFHEAEETPNKNVWQRIEKQLDEHNTTVHIIPRRYTWIKYAAAALILLGTTLVLLKINYTTKLPSADKETNITAGSTTDNITIAEPIERGAALVNEKEIQNYTKPKLSQQISATKQTQFVSNKSDRSTQQQRINIELATNNLEETKPNSTNIKDIQQVNLADIPVRQVTEMEAIKPLIDLDEDLEVMYAQAPHETANKSIVTTILNTISEKLEVSPTKDVRFRTDEEGSFRIDIINSLVRNRNKKK
ncbi:hypothetical protein [Sphingobacterium tabacisoli]|uniref:Uncharacterized protein n=1 Tax=Sphingobacterium tabacisoli TaxID=2044855 RepID=A0ABW5KYF0_9SPHI|nr:hypothetical protein [Sphingobacterium tabacisoli]